MIFKSPNLLVTDNMLTFISVLFLTHNHSSFIDEGNPIAGGHGDFKEDETTTLYWKMIKVELDSSAYDL